MSQAAGTERFDTVIIGGGQAGLVAGYYLAKLGRPFVILDANERIGGSWRHRWDTFRLFTPARYNGLPGMRFPAKGWSFPTGIEQADYLEAYAKRFKLPVRTGVLVDGLTRDGERFEVSTSDGRIEADNVILATGAMRTPKTPGFAHELSGGIVQMHSSEYRSPSQLKPGRVLLVGAGNSGAEIASDLVETHEVLLAGKIPGQIPIKHGSTPARLAMPLIKFLGHHVLTWRSPIGRKALPKLGAKGTPLIRIKRKDLEAMGVELLPRVTAVKDGYPVVGDERVVEVENVIWCTGYRMDLPWVDLPIFGADGHIEHTRGIAKVPGLYFGGLLHQFSESSDVLPGAGRDARYVVRHLAARARANGRVGAPHRTSA